MRIRIYVNHRTIYRFVHEIKVYDSPDVCALFSAAGSACRYQLWPGTVLVMKMFKSLVHSLFLQISHIYFLNVSLHFNTHTSRINTVSSENPVSQI